MKLSEEELSIMEIALVFRTPLYKLCNEMPYDEYVAWLHFFEERPVGRAEDYRAAVIASSMNGKIPVDTLFPSLSQRKQRTMADSLKGSVLLGRIQDAVGGDKLEL